MNALLEWLSSQSGSSVIVAPIALFRVFGTTFWSNRAADRRRLQDQTAEDTRRKAELQQSEDERSHQRLLEDARRQRLAVAIYISEILEESHSSSDTFLRNMKDPQIHTLDDKALRKGIALNHFYKAATASLNICNPESTNPCVRLALIEVWNCFEEANTQLNDPKTTQGGEEWLRATTSTEPLSEEARRALRN